MHVISSRRIDIQEWQVYTAAYEGTVRYLDLEAEQFVLVKATPESDDRAGSSCAIDFRQRAVYTGYDDGSVEMVCDSAAVDLFYNLVFADDNQFVQDDIRAGGKDTTKWQVCGAILLLLLFSDRK